MGINFSRNAFRHIVFILLLSSNVHAGEYGTSPKLPLPSSLPLVDYEKILFPWIAKREYEKLNWRHDKSIRDTGPFLNGQFHGTHPAVYIYYSPEIMEWLVDRESGIDKPIPDGAIIVKEMYTPTAGIYAELKRIKGKAVYDELRPKLISGYTVMVKDSKASADGWFWSSPPVPTPENYSCANSVPTIPETVVAHLDTFQNNKNPNSTAGKYGVRDSGYGLPCLRCHASAKDELTFSSLRNIHGFKPDEDPLRFVDDGTWRKKETFSSYPLCMLMEEQWNLPSWFFGINDIQLLGLEQVSSPAAPSGHSVEPVTEQDTLKKSEKKKPYINKTFVKTFKKHSPSMRPVKDIKDVRKFPQQWLDHVVQKSGKPQAYITSDNCLGCHGGLAEGTFQQAMFISTGTGSSGYDVSEYGEWRWSPMGLAGRDPIFHAQLESEMAILIKDGKNPKSGLIGSVEENQTAVTNTCLSCHGAMGQRQLKIDSAHNPELDVNMKPEYFYFTEQLEKSQTVSKAEDTYYHYGNLAREGISCMVCHSIVKADDQKIEAWANRPDIAPLLKSGTDVNLAYLLYNNATGQYEKTENGTIHGPFDVIEKPMEHALNLIPKKDDFIQDSQLCGTCHTINLPNIGAELEEDHSVLTSSEKNPAFKSYDHTLEQATFLEWQNSDFSWGKTKQSCQDCHMKGNFETLDGSLKIEQIVTQIAAIEDSQYPDVDEDLPNKDIDVPLRDNYKRHTHVGLNAFLLEMFKQYEEVLGVAPYSYMTDAKIDGESYSGVNLALDSMKLQARDSTANVTVKSAKLNGNTLTAQVHVKNKVGHRFPSGVAFRRAFIELKVKHKDKLVWASGQTNKAGVITDTKGVPLSTEFFNDKEDACSPYQTDGKFDINKFNQASLGLSQPHYQVITDDKQVQIYEELNLNKECNFTTSFVHRVHHVKDNRLLPDGWRNSTLFEPEGELMVQFMEATDPKNTMGDPDYINNPSSPFEGGDSFEYRIELPKKYKAKNVSVEATLYFQAIPPYWLKQRFDLAPNGEGTKRLYFLASRLNLDNTPMKNWKFEINKDIAQVK